MPKRTPAWEILAAPSNATNNIKNFFMYKYRPEAAKNVCVKGDFYEVFV
jgi:hypothetical protein